MKKIFVGPIHNLYIKSINIKDINKIEKDKYTVIKDALFYINHFGHVISFDYNTVLPQKEEAEYYLQNYIKNNKLTPEKITPDRASCIYIEDEELKPYKTISNNEFKVLKKQYKNKKN